MTPMTFENPFACIRSDNGLVSEILHVSPMYIRCGPSSRGRFGDRRSARSRRTDARHQRAAMTVGTGRDVTVLLR